MATPVSDSYIVSSGSIVAGRTNNPVAASVANVGTVTTLLKDWSGSGFQLLSTIPDGLFVVNTPGHSGATWDEARQTLWIFGSETHGDAQTDNAVYRFDTATGKMHKQYVDSPRNTGFHMRAADGILFADAAETKPWGFHTFSNVKYDTTTKEIIVSADQQDHSYATSWPVPPITEGQKASIKFPIWYYNTVTGNWRYNLTPATHAFSATELGCGMVKEDGNGLWRVGGNNLTHLSEDGNTVTNYSIYGKLSNVLIQSMPHLTGTKLISLGGFTDTYTNFGYVCHLDNPSGGAHSMLSLSSFPILSGWDLRNMWSVKMPDGRILFGAYRASPTAECGAFIFDWNNGSPTITDTGHRLAAATINPINTYDLRTGWSTKYNCAIVSTLRHGGHKIIGVRV